MTDHPILFSSPMIRNILDGRKTQTRRILEVSDDLADKPFTGELVNYYGDRRLGMSFEGTTRVQPIPYTPGDRIWLREAWRADQALDDLRPRQMSGRGFLHYEAHGAPSACSAYGRYRHARFMPRWASRLTLTVTDVRVQRLQEISATDVEAEGALNYPGHPGCGPAINCYGPDCPTNEARSCNKHGCWGIREDFAALWDGLNAKRGYGWDANPWVAAITFEAHQCNIDQMAEAADA